MQTLEKFCSKNMFKVNSKGTRMSLWGKSKMKSPWEGEGVPQICLID